MNSPTPTGRLAPGGTGHDLVLTRSLPGSVDDAWASITEPERTARWIGRWEGDGRRGATIRLQLGFEESAPWMDAQIIECDAPTRVRVVTTDSNGTWDLAIELHDVNGRAELTFVMRSVDPDAVGEIGPGWEYYLDQLIAAMSDSALPDFDEYYPSQRDYYTRQAADLGNDARP